MTQELRLEHRLRDGSQGLGLCLTSDQVRQLLQLIQLLTRWGRVYNLTAVRAPLEMVAYHLLDSLALASHLENDPILDIGTGAGFPGLPLAIIRPEQVFTLLDSNSKKIRFVRQAVLELGLRNIQVVQSRIESYKNERKFATIMARAFAAIPLMLQWVEPLLRRPAVLLAPKGRQVQAELESIAASREGDQLQIQVHRLKVPYVVGPRPLVKIYFP